MSILRPSTLSRPFYCYSGRDFIHSRTRIRHDPNESSPWCIFEWSSPYVNVPCASILIHVTTIVHDYGLNKKSINSWSVHDKLFYCHCRHTLKYAHVSSSSIELDWNRLKMTTIVDNTIAFGIKLTQTWKESEKYREKDGWLWFDGIRVFQPGQSEIRCQSQHLRQASEFLKHLQSIDSLLFWFLMGAAKGWVQWKVRICNSWRRRVSYSTIDRFGS